MCSLEAATLGRGGEGLSFTCVLLQGVNAMLPILTKDRRWGSSGELQGLTFGPLGPGKPTGPWGPWGPWWGKIKT